MELISGNTRFLVHDSHVRDFLNEGGFKKLRTKKRNELVIKRIVFIISLLTFGLLLYSTFFQNNQ